MNKINILNKHILIIGLGSIGKRHLRNLFHLGFKNISILRKSNKIQLDIKYIKMLQNLYTSDSEAFKKNPEYVIICVPTSFHRKYIVQSNLINAQILCEIPLLHNYSDKDLNYLKSFYSQNKNKIFITGFNFRFHPIIQKISKIIKSNEIGEPMFSKLHFGERIDNIHTWDDFKSRYEVRKELGGGVMRTSSHEIDMAYFLFGKIKNLYCEKKNLKIKDINCEDFVQINLNHTTGVNTTIILDFISNTYSRSLEIFFTNGIIKWNFKNNTFDIFKKNKWIKKKYQYDFNQTYINEIKCLFNLKKNNNYADFQDGLYIQKIISKLDNSSKKGIKITLR